MKDAIGPPPGRLSPAANEALTVVSVAAEGGIVAFDRLVRQVMTKGPYASARRVFWIVDNGPTTAARGPSIAFSAAGQL